MAEVSEKTKLFIKTSHSDSTSPWQPPINHENYDYNVWIKLEESPKAFTRSISSPEHPSKDKFLFPPSNPNPSKSFLENPNSSNFLKNNSNLEESNKNFKLNYKNYFEQPCKFVNISKDQNKSFEIYSDCDSSQDTLQKVIESNDNFSFETEESIKDHSKFKGFFGKIVKKFLNSPPSSPSTSSPSSNNSELFYKKLSDESKTSLNISSNSSHLSDLNNNYISFSFNKDSKKEEQNEVLCEIQKMTPSEFKKLNETFAMMNDIRDAKILTNETKGGLIKKKIIRRSTNKQKNNSESEKSPSPKAFKSVSPLNFSSEQHKILDSNKNIKFEKNQNKETSIEKQEEIKNENEIENFPSDSSKLKIKQTKLFFDFWTPYPIKKQIKNHNIEFKTKFLDKNYLDLKKKNRIKNKNKKELPMKSFIKNIFYQPSNHHEKTNLISNKDQTTEHKITFYILSTNLNPNSSSENTLVDENDTTVLETENESKTKIIKEISESPPPLPPRERFNSCTFSNRGKKPKLPLRSEGFEKQINFQNYKRHSVEISKYFSSSNSVLPSSPSFLTSSSPFSSSSSSSSSSVFKFSNSSRNSYESKDKNSSTIQEKIDHISKLIPSIQMENCHKKLSSIQETNNKTNKLIEKNKEPILPKSYPLPSLSSDSGVGSKSSDEEKEEDEEEFELVSGGSSLSEFHEEDYPYEIYFENILNSNDLKTTTEILS